MRNPRSVLTVAIIVFALVVGVGAFGVMSIVGDVHSRNAALLLQSLESLPYPYPEAEATSSDTSEEPEIITITGRHIVRGETHKVFGEILLPSTCDLLSVEALPRETKPASIELAFVATSTEGAIDCEEANAPTPYSVEFDAEPSVILTASWNAGEAILSLVKD